MCITGGEALTGEHLARIRAAFKPSVFFNAYGPTETVVMPLASLAPEVLEEGLGSVPIGSVIGARVAYILDATWRWCRKVRPASCTSAGPAWPRVITSGPA